MKLGENVLKIIEYEKRKKIKTNLLAFNKYMESRNNERIENSIKQRANTSFVFEGFWD